MGIGNEKNNSRLFKNSGTRFLLYKRLLFDHSSSGDFKTNINFNTE